MVSTKIRPPSTRPPANAERAAAAAIAGVTRMILLTPSGVSASQAGSLGSRPEDPIPGSAVRRDLALRGRCSAHQLLSMGSCRSGFRGTASPTLGGRRRFQTSYSNRAAAWPAEGAPTSLAPWLTSSVVLGVLHVVGDAPVC